MIKKHVILLGIKIFLWRIALWWCTSLRIQKVNAEKFDELKRKEKNYVVAFWHGSMVVGWFLHRPRKANNVSALVSQSSDGEFLSAMLERWNYKLIRGSSTVGGKEAMQLMIDEVKKGNSLAITPDGPRGPRHEMKMGAVRTAQQANVPLVLVGIAMERKKMLRSWDKFEVPVPFSKAVAVYSEPIHVPVELHGEPLDKYKHDIERRLQTLTFEAEQLLVKEGSAQ